MNSTNKITTKFLLSTGFKPPEKSTGYLEVWRDSKGNVLEVFMGTQFTLNGNVVTNELDIISNKK